VSVFNRQKPRVKPQLTLRIFLWGLVDVVGILLVSLGIVHFAYGPGRIFASFPESTVQALATLAGGAAIMIWAAGNILREMMKQPQFGDSDNGDAR